MKNILKYIAGTLLASFIIAACNDDEGNYNYLTEDELNELIIRIDTTGMENRYAFSSRYNMFHLPEILYLPLLTP